MATSSSDSRFLIQDSRLAKSAWRILDVILGGVFVYAGVLKVLDPVRFAHDIDNYKMLPWTIAAGVAFYLPWLEIFCGVAVVIHRLYRGGLFILTALMVVFLIATIAAKARGLDITCGCFGHASQHWSFGLHLLVDLGLLVSAVILLLRAQIGHRTA